MSQKDYWQARVVAGALVGLLLGICLAGPAEAASPTSQVCAAVKGEEVSSSKTLSPSVLAVPAEYSVLALRPSESGCSPLDPTPNLVAANLWGDLVSRAPPPLR